MINIEQLSKIGLGTYRMTIKSDKHYDAMGHALDCGVNLIDTSSNYTNGDSERLIGTYLKESNKEAFIVTKAGYIQGDNIRHFQDLLSTAQVEHIHVSDELLHSIDPLFLQQQLDFSLGRLERESVDCFLLHNPEYYFEGSNPANTEEYYNRIKKAFIFLEEQVKKGKIRYYGISSNTFPSPPEQLNSTDINKVIEIVNEVSVDNHLKFIQFPHNLIEQNALTNFHGKPSLLETIKANNLVSLSNRPLNAFSDSGLLRLASYDEFLEHVHDSKAEELFDTCMQLISEKWQSQTGEQPDLQKIPLLKQLTEIWNDLPSPDAVDQVFLGHFFPFLAQVWGGQGLGPKQAEPFYQLYEMAKDYAKMNLSRKADGFFGELIKSGQIKNQDNVPLSVMAIEKYIEEGIDHILLGMRQIEYINQVKHLF